MRREVIVFNTAERLLELYAAMGITRPVARQRMLRADRADRQAAMAGGVMRVIVTGSRNYEDAGAVFDALDTVHLMHEAFTLVHGACRTGADYWAHIWAGLRLDRGVTEELHPADWKTHGLSAGPIRNAEMIKAGADLVLAFPLPGGRGTQHMIRLAKEAGIPVKIWGTA